MRKKYIVKTCFTYGTRWISEYDIQEKTGTLCEKEEDALLLDKKTAKIVADIFDMEAVRKGGL